MANKNILDKNSADIAAEKLEQFKKLFPEAMSEGRVDVEALRRSLGENVASNDERYNLDWAGKTEAFKALQTPTIATLAPCPEESVDFDKTGNVFIEGENLEVLKVLQKAYYGKIKMIYIDPPYNTGSDSFIYPDRFQESKEEYLKRIEEKDEEGYLLKEGLFRRNSKENGHYHSNWLSMMYPRLFLARNLLRDDGVIFVSIDDNEVHNLRLLMNEIFGEENFVAEFPRVTKKAGKSSDRISKNNDYVLCYAKSDITTFIQQAHTDEGFKLSDEYVETRGKYKLNQTLDYDTLGYVSSLDYPIRVKNEIYYAGSVPQSEHERRKTENPKDGFRWRWSKDLFDFGLKNGFVVIKDGKNGKRIYTKTYQNSTIEKENGGYIVKIEDRTKSVTSLDFVENRFSNDNAKKDLDELFNAKVFDYSKPVSLAKMLAKISIQNDEIVFDFFAGSCTTAQALMELNSEDGGNRRFICVQLPEKADEASEAFKAGYKTIAQIGKERIRRAIEKIKAEGTKSDRDLGFKVFKLKNSNFKIWRGDVVDSAEDLEMQMDLLKDPVKPEAQEQNLLWELLLKSGYDLNTKITEQKAGKCLFYSVAGGEMAVILGKADEKCLQEIVKLKPRKVICLDSIFEANDQLKTNTALQMKDAGIEFRTI